MDDTGRQLRELREAAGLSQPTVAAELGISRQAVAKWEAGRARPDVFRLRRLDDLYSAGGKVLGVFGLGDETASRVDQLERAVGVLTQAVDEIQAQLVELWRTIGVEGVDDGAGRSVRRSD